jgi:hypothetical protein
MNTRIGVFLLSAGMGVSACGARPSSAPTPEFVAAIRDISPAPTAEVVAAMPDTIPCERAVVVEARRESQGVAVERRWLAVFYPGHGDYFQALVMSDGRVYDVLLFPRANGRMASVCFDIGRFYGRWD